MTNALTPVFTASYDVPSVVGHLLKRLMTHHSGSSDFQTLFVYVMQWVVSCRAAASIHWRRHELSSLDQEVQVLAVRLRPATTAAATVATTINSNRPMNCSCLVTSTVEVWPPA